MKLICKQTLRSLNIYRLVFTLILFIFLSESKLVAQWTQVGQDVDGEISGEQSGSALSLSANGNTMAIGAWASQGGGQVRIYKNVSNTWVLDENFIGGPTIGYFGVSVSLSADGTIVAIGASASSAGGNWRGLVRLYQNSGGTWSQFGNDILGENDDDNLGFAVSLSADGTTVAIGEIYQEGSGLNRGRVSVFQNIANIWTLKGNRIEGHSDFDFFGFAVSISGDGSRFLASSQHSSGGALYGYARVFEYDEGIWNQLGSDIYGEAIGDGFGEDLSISDDGSSIAIGGPFNNGAGSYAGHVRVYQYNGVSWGQIGNDIDGEEVEEFLGAAVSISEDGTKVLTGGNGNDGGGLDRGQVRMYEFVNNTWVQYGCDINGEADFDYSGDDIDLAQNGAIIAVGAPYNTDGGLNSGHVRVYHYSSDSDCDCIPDEMDLCDGGDDSIDNNQDGIPDCHLFPGYENVPTEWLCSNNANSTKVKICHNGQTLCVNINAVPAHIAHGDYIGPCNNSPCEGQNYNLPNDHESFSIAQPRTFNLASMTVFPNPSEGEINISLEGMEGKMVQLSMFDQLGKEVWKSQSTEGNSFYHFTIDDKNIGNGVYLLRLQTGDETHTERILINR